MDDLLILLLLVVGVAILSGLVLPIIALVISIRSRRRLTARIEKLEAAQPSPVSGTSEQAPISDSLPAATIRRLETRIEKLEAACQHVRLPLPKWLMSLLSPPSTDGPRNQTLIKRP